MSVHYIWFKHYKTGFSAILAFSHEVAVQNASHEVFMQFFLTEIVDSKCKLL